MKDIENEIEKEIGNEIENEITNIVDWVYITLFIFHLKNIDDIPNSKTIRTFKILSFEH